MIFNHKDTKYLRDYQLFLRLFYPELKGGSLSGVWGGKCGRYSVRVLVLFRRRVGKAVRQFAYLAAKCPEQSSGYAAVGHEKRCSEDLRSSLHLDISVLSVRRNQYSSSLKRAGVIDCQSFMRYCRLVHKQTLL